MGKNSVVDLLSVDNLFTTQAEREDAKLERVLEIPLAEISDFPNHPFHVRMDERMVEMADSVKQYGVLVPALVRLRPEGGYEKLRQLRKTLIEDVQGVFLCLTEGIYLDFLCRHFQNFAVSQGRNAFLILRVYTLRNAVIVSPAA